MEYGSDYINGNAWQYSWYEPQDVGGLTHALGSQERLVTELDAVFDTKVNPKGFANVEDVSGLIGNCAHGNEPSHHAGGTLKFVMQAQPNKTWGTQPKDRPYSMEAY